MHRTPCMVLGSDSLLMKLMSVLKKWHKLLSIMPSACAVHDKQQLMPLLQDVCVIACVWVLFAQMVSDCIAMYAST